MENFYVKTLISEWVTCQLMKRLTGQAHIQTRIQATILRCAIDGKGYWNREAQRFGLWLGERKQNSMLPGKCI